MKSWYAFVPVGISLLVFARFSQIERQEPAAILPVATEVSEECAWTEPSPAVEVREDSAWTAPSPVAADLRERLPDQPAQVLQQQAYRPAPHGPATAVPPRRKTRPREARQQARRDEAPQTMPRMVPQEREAQERQRIEQIVSRLDDVFYNEPHDGGWAAQIEESIAEDFEAEEWHGHMLAEASCRATLCRIIVHHADQDTADSFLVRLGTLAVFADTEGFYQEKTLADGTATTVVYIARQGHRLPDLP